MKKARFKDKEKRARAIRRVFECDQESIDKVSKGMHTAQHKLANAPNIKERIQKVQDEELKNTLASVIRVMAGMTLTGENFFKYLLGSIALTIMENERRNNDNNREG